MYIAFAGAPDSGKTTLAMAVSARMTYEGMGNTYVDEYPREFISRFGVPESVSDQYFILRKQMEKEDVARGNGGHMVTDSPVFLNYTYVVGLMKSAKDREIATDVLRHVMAYKYDHIFYLESFREPIDDGVRTVHLKRIPELAAAIKGYMGLWRMEYVTLGPMSLTERVEAAWSRLFAELTPPS